MPDLWMPGAEKHDIGSHAATDAGPAKAIAHITWDKNATAAKPVDLVPFANLKAYFTGGGKGVAPHVLWDPFHGTFAQFLPANSRSFSVEDHTGGTRTNRAGSVVLQVEALFFPYCRVDGKVYAHLTDTPLKGWDSLHAWIKSWGVPDTWPMGVPNGFTSHRDEHTWETRAGWYGHGQVPENTHTDPGTWPAFPAPPKAAAGSSGSAPALQPFPGAAFFMSGSKPAIGKSSAIFTAMGKRLVVEGCGHYKVGPGPKLGQADVDSYQAFQRKCGFTGSAAKWPPGKTTWDRLQVPKVV
ncbi:peptidoglycan-binding protein [Streptomyces sp. NPDC021020]|uniref:peptidoglycan-binding protein n=1 Tax=Streptomyces sp. NPDC021020 TaxID=3365109 RepID=UPI00379CFE64